MAASQTANAPGVEPGWDFVVEVAWDRWLNHRSSDYQYVMRAVIGHFERLIGRPRDVNTITSDVVDRFRAGLAVDEGISSSSRHTYMKHLRTLLGWFHRHGFLHRMPEFTFDRQGRNAHMRGRPVRPEGYEALLIQAGDRPIRRLISCMYLGGLRFAEAMKLSWDDPPFRIDLDNKYPRFVIWAEGQKSKRDEYAPMTPDFADYLRGLAGLHEGRVCQVEYSQDHLGRLFRQVASRAGVNCTPHDLRRAFGTRWALRVKPAVLQRLMRHSSYTTTAKYYVAIDSDDVGELLAGLE